MNAWTMNVLRVEEMAAKVLVLVKVETWHKVRQSVHITILLAVASSSALLHLQILYVHCFQVHFS